MKLIKKMIDWMFRRDDNKSVSKKKSKQRTESMMRDAFTYLSHNPQMKARELSIRLGCSVTNAWHIRNKIVLRNYVVNASGK